MPDLVSQPTDAAISAGIQAADSGFTQAIRRGDIKAAAGASAQAGEEAHEQFVKTLGEMPAKFDPSRLPAVEPPKETAPPAQPTPRSLIEDFGSASVALALLGGALLKLPIGNSMQAAGQAIQAARKKDWNAYEDSYKRWQDQSTLAWKQADFQAKAFDRALEVMKTDMSQGEAMLRLAVQTAGYDEQVRDALLSNPALTGELSQKLAEGALRIKDNQDKVQVLDDYLDASRSLQDALASGDPEAIKKAQAAFSGAQQRHEGVFAPAWAAKPVSLDTLLNQLIEQRNALALTQGPDAPGLAALDQQIAAAKAGIADIAGAKKGEKPLDLTDPGTQGRIAMVAAGAPRAAVAITFGATAQYEWDQLQRQAILEIQKENPQMDAAAAGRELASRGLDFKGAGGSVAFLNKQLATTNQAVKQLDFNIGKTEEILRGFSPTEDISPVVTALARGAQKWTGDPEYSQLFFYMDATAKESARILQGATGTVQQLHEGAAKEAKKWADADWTTPRQFIEGAAPAMRAEGANRITNFTQSIAEARALAGGASTGAEGGPVRISTDAEYDALASGALFVGPDGKTRKKP